MKTIKNIFGFLLATITLFATTSCGEKEVDYVPAEKPNNAQVFFPGNLASTVELNTDETSFIIEVHRAENASAQTVTLTATDGTGKLSIPSAVDFAAGAEVANLVIGYNPADFEYEVFSEVTISIPESEATPYGISSYTFQVGVPAPWTEWELFNTGTYTFTQYYSGTHDARECYVRTYKLDENIQQFRFDDLADAYSFIVDYDASTGKCLVQPQHIMNHADYGPIYIASTHVYWMDIKGDATATEEAVGASTFDSQTGTFSLNVAYYVGAGYFGYGYEYMQLDGYELPDYTLSLTEAGHFVTSEGVDNMVFHIAKGADIAKYKYLATPGALKAAEVNDTMAGIVDGSIESTEGTETGYLSFEFPAAGDYTVVVVGFNADGLPIASDYISIEYLPVGQDDPWQSLGMCSYTDDVVLPMYTEEGATYTYQVEIQERTDKPGLFRLVNPYGEAFPFYEYGTYPEKDVYVEIDAQDPTAVTIEYQSLGLDLGEGEIGIYAAASYYMDGGYTKEEIVEQGLFGSYTNGVITFPTKAVFFALGDKLYYANQHGAFKVDMTKADEAAATRSIFAPKKSAFDGEFALKAPIYKGIKVTKIDADLFTKHRQSTVK